MHKQYLTNEEDIEFPKMSSAKQMPGNNLKAKHREIGITATISPELKLEQGVFQCVLQSLYYNLDFMNKLTHNIHEVMVFPKWLSVKQNLQKLPSPKFVLCISFWTLETNASLAPIFFRFSHL
jgi:hypothetical protein